MEIVLDERDPDCILDHYLLHALAKEALQREELERAAMVRKELAARKLTRAQRRLLRSSGLPMS